MKFNEYVQMLTESESNEIKEGDKVYFFDGTDWLKGKVSTISKVVNGKEIYNVSNHGESLSRKHIRTNSEQMEVINKKKYDGDFVSDSITLILNAGDATFKIFVNLPEPMSQNKIDDFLKAILKSFKSDAKKEDVEKAILDKFKGSTLAKSQPESTTIFKKYI